MYLTTSLPARQKAYSLIEVLVAMVILALGLLGIASLQLFGVKANQGSYFRSQATAIMTDLAERMRSNVVGAQAGRYAGFDSNAVSCTTPPTICAKENSATAPSTCNAQAMAVYDRFVVACGLPTGTGSVRVGGIADVMPGARIQVVCVDNTAAVPAPPTLPTAASPCLAAHRHYILVSWQDRTTRGATDVPDTQFASMLVQP